MDSLAVVTLARNNLTGMSHFGARRMVSLVLDRNPLTASLEPMLAWAWPMMRQLSMSNCQLWGTLPPGGCCTLFQQQDAAIALVTSIRLL